MSGIRRSHRTEKVAMSGTRASVLRFSLTGAVTMLVLFVACWLAAAIGGLPATHMYIGLFASGEIGSFATLCVGSFWSLVWGGFAGAVIAISYNLLSVVDRR